MKQFLHVVPVTADLDSCYVGWWIWWNGPVSGLCDCVIALMPPYSCGANGRA